MKTILLSNGTDKTALLQKIGVTKEGISFLKDKMEINFIYIKQIKTPAALILKQDALSIGADLAVHKNTILNMQEKTDALLLATDKQLKLLVKKESLQPFGLKELTKDLKSYINLPDNDRVEVMGVINANDDSFFEGSRFVGEKAFEQIL
ncbi:MAG: dihydropteroate synthase, partial [Epsilonproteobacteria bacterium]|nr:dihydropteroate synthase [Campylobacterota bacterium]